MHVLKHKYVVWFICITLMLLYAIMCKLWLISDATNNPILYVQGAKPVAKSAYYFVKDLHTSWSSILSIPEPATPPYVLVAWVYAFPSNVSWVLYGVFLPFIGGILFTIFMLLFMKNILRGRSHNDRLILLATFVSGFMYEIILLSPWIDIWTKGFRALLPLTLIFLMLTFSRLNDILSLISFSMLTGLLLTSLYDIRIILASIMLIIVFTVIHVLSNRTKIRETYSLNKKAFFIFIIIAVTMFILRVVPTLMVMSLKVSNPFGGIRTLTLPVIVGHYDFVSVLGLPFPLLKNIRIVHIISMLLLAFVLGCILFSKQSRELRQVTLVLVLVLISIASIIYSSSPLKVIQQSLVKVTILNINVGVLFRTPRFFITINNVILSMLMGLSVYMITSDFKQRSFNRRVIFLTLLLSLIISLAYVNVYVNSSDISPRWQKASPLPKYYYDVYNLLKDKIRGTLFRVLWLPRTGKYSGERPIWLKSVCWGVGEKAFPLRTYFYYGKPMEYIYSFILRLGIEGRMKALSEILSYMGVKYIIVVTDYWWEGLRENAFSIINNLNKSQYFKEVYNNGKLYVFENLQTKSALRLVSTPIIIEGGLQTLADAIGKGLEISNALIVFSDQIIPPDAIEKSKIVIAHSMPNLEMDLLVQLLYWERVSTSTNACIIVPSKYALGLERDRWHPYFIANPHHGEWEVFYTWALKSKGRYDLDFRHDWGFVGATKEGQKLDIPIKITKAGNYVIAIRYLESVRGGEFVVKLDSSPIAKVLSLNSSNSFQWFLARVHISEGKHILALENKRGRNAINIILLIPEDEYNQGLRLVKGILSNKTIVLINNVEDSQKWPRISSLNSHIVKCCIHGNDYIAYISTTGVNFPIYLVIPEQWYPDWSASFNNTLFKSTFGFPSIFITAFEINPAKHNVKIKYLKVEARPISDEVQRAIFNYEIILSLVVVGITLVPAIVRRH